ncbi:hypothetical protein [Saccharothrix variisporea]|uniref:Uncharacterized protein n=1 Tax=Saccharothrix variisporea TaxID=543527 RepID=A0A495X1C4_9PSEU|nr:hypothetical protein [Saccharothrix variisporea]RKT67720.1 hypothetical protein DFJ66_0896 [Saccharothrix variisporea]
MCLYRVPGAAEAIATGAAQPAPAAAGSTPAAAEPVPAVAEPEVTDQLPVLEEISR